MNKSLDDVLRYALFPQDEADERLNQTILNHLKEDSIMKPYHKKRISTAILVAILILCFSSITVYAAWKYLTPDEIAKEVNKTKLADAFLSEDAIVINETQTYGDYQVTLLGIVSGKDISDAVGSYNGILQNDRSYIAVAFEYADGSPMPGTSEAAYEELEFCVSPLVKGYDPIDVNIFTLKGDYTDLSENGILYRLLECDNLMILANHEMYLSISDTFTPDRACYTFDPVTGIITRNEEYHGLNALFSLSLDISLADDKAATALLTELIPLEDESGSNAIEETVPTESIPEESEIASNDTPQESSGSVESVTSVDSMTYFDIAGLPFYDWTLGITTDNIDQYADIIDSNIQVVFPDENGNIDPEPMRVTGSRRMRDLGPHSVSRYASMEIGVLTIIGWGSETAADGSSSHDFITCTRNADGSYTFAWYTPKQSP